MNAWQFHPARDRELDGIERHRSLLRENGLASSVARLFWWCGVRVGLRVWHRLSVSGLRNLPARPPFVLVANHTSHLDAPILISLLPLAWRDIVFPVAASDAFFERPATAAFADWFLNALAIRRRSACRHDLDEMRGKLKKGDAVLIIFPEGTRSRTGKMQPFLAGTGRLVAGSDVPVVPCHLQGCFRAFPPGSRLIKPRHIRVKIGVPLRFADCADNHAGWDTIARQLETAVAGLADRTRSELAAGG